MLNVVLEQKTIKITAAQVLLVKPCFYKCTCCVQVYLCLKNCPIKATPIAMKKVHQNIFRA